MFILVADEVYSHFCSLIFDDLKNYRVHVEPNCEHKCHSFFIQRLQTSSSSILGIFLTYY